MTTLVTASDRCRAVAYASGVTMPGLVEQSLLLASQAAGPEEAVSAYLSDDLVWMYVPADRVAYYENTLRHQCLTIYVEEG